jgi:hypothetical protein
MSTFSELPQLSYGKILKDIYNFRSSGTTTGSDFNLYDTPGQKYFKIMFYFGGLAEDETKSDYLSGLLAPSWEFNLTDNSYYMSNSAWAYLKMNGEDTRADQLKQFISLLSNINTEAPWYFTSIGGLSDALERKVCTDGKLDIGECKKITINCLPDAFDNRITTLLELYRSCTWSWSLKKEIIPSNLRKFDMAIYIFESPGLTYYQRDKANSNYSESNKYSGYPTIDNNTSNAVKPSYKMIEFHNCEIDYNSIKSGWNELNNQSGFNPTYAIDIMYDDCYEISYNDQIMQSIGDMIAIDTWQAVISDGVVRDTLPKVTPPPPAAATVSNPLSIKVPEVEEVSKYTTETTITYGNIYEDDSLNRVGTSTRQDKVEYVPGFLSNAVGQVAGHLKKDLTSLVKRAVLGNLYTVSLTKVAAEVGDLLNGNIIKTGMTAKEYIQTAQQRAADKVKKSADGNIYVDDPSYNSMKITGKAVGNIYKRNTIANNI